MTAKQVESTPKQETWKAFFVMGLLFPLHLILGMVSLPVWMYYCAMGSRNAWLFTLFYLPFYLWPAQSQYPGWKGANGFWDWMQYAETGESYFGEFDVHGTENVDKDQQYCVACHPHGTVIFQRTFWRSKLLDEVFKNPWRMIGASALYYIPIVRELTLWFGAVNATKETCEMLLRAGSSLVIYPGGLDEANSTEGNGQDVRLKTRTGFIRLAVKHNTPVLPVFTFGELDCVDAVNALPSTLSKWLKKTLRMSSTIFMGRFWTFIPYRVPFHMCIGKPIAVKHFPEESIESDAEVARIHALYKAQLKSLYQTNKKQFGYNDRPLVFVCEEEEARKAKKHT